MGASRWTLPVPLEQAGSGPNYCACASARSAPIQVADDAWRSGTRRAPCRGERDLQVGQRSYGGAQVGQTPLPFEDSAVSTEGQLGGR
eukprot:3770700-Alexandrium_andersonii.AAC.1